MNKRRRLIVGSSLLEILRIATHFPAVQAGGRALPGEPLPRPIHHAHMPGVKRVMLEFKIANDRPARQRLGVGRGFDPSDAVYLVVVFEEATTCPERPARNVYDRAAGVVPN